MMTDRRMELSHGMMEMVYQPNVLKKYMFSDESSCSFMALSRHNVFPGTWIRRQSLLKWPPRSPDLNSLEFFLWGHHLNICCL